MKSSERRLATSTGLLLVFCVFLALWKTGLWLHIPLPTTDGVQSLSHTFSILRGDFLHSLYWHNWMAIFQLPYGYGLITAPFMGLLPFGVLNNFFVTELLLTAITAFLAYHLIATSQIPHAKLFAALASAAVFAHPQLWTLRPETLTLPLLLLALIIIRASPHWIALALAALLIVLAGLTQPLGGLIGVIMITLFELEKRRVIQRIILSWVMVVLWLSLLYLPVILIDVSSWEQNFIGFFTREEPRGLATLGGALTSSVRAVAWTALLIMLYALAAMRSWRQPSFSLRRELIFLLVLLVPMVMGGMGYYFAYLILFIVWRLSEMPLLMLPPLSLRILIVLVIPLFSYYVPTLQNVENPRYGETVRAILDYTDSYSDRTDPGMLWVSTQAGYPLIDEPYARVLANYVELGRYDTLIPLHADDEVLFISETERSILMGNFAVTPDNIVVETVIEPVPGLLTAESGFRVRLPSLGLWRVTLR